MSIQERLSVAMKSMTSADLGDSKLTPEKANQFIKVLANASPVLDNARRITMKSHTRDIDRISFGANLVKGTEGVAPAEGDKATLKTNKLIVEEYVMVQNLTDSAIEDSIDQLDNVIVELMGNQAGYDLEAFGLVKWLDLAGHQVTAVGTDVEAIMSAAILALPVKYDRNRANLKFFVSRKFEDKYRDALRARGTILGDSATVGGQPVTYKGIELIVVPGLAEDKAILVDPNNVVYGIYRDIRIEEQRWAAKRSTDFVLSLRADFNFENEDAVVVVNGITYA